MTAKNNNVLIAFSTIFIIAFINNIYNNKQLLSKFLELVTDKYWIGSFLLIIGWSYYVLIGENKLDIYKKEEQYEAEIATKHALIAFLIAFCHHMEMTIWIFWLIWVITFQVENWA